MAQIIKYPKVYFRWVHLNVYIYIFFDLLIFWEAIFWEDHFGRVHNPRVVFLIIYLGQITGLVN